MKKLKHILIWTVCLLPWVAGLICFLTGYCYWFGCTRDDPTCSVTRGVLTFTITIVWAVAGFFYVANYVYEKGQWK